LYLSRFNPPIHVPSLSIISIVLYYIIFLYFLVCLTRKKKRYSGFYLFFYITILISIRIVNPYYTVTIIDVGQGDSILIELPQNKGNILVDSYGSNTSYLKSIGIRKLDYVILTHFDQDHIGALGNTMEEFQVGTILYSVYEDVKKIKNATVPLIPIQSGDEIQWKGINLKVLGPIYSYSDSNSNSVVLSFNIKGYTFLLTGDMTAKEEADLIQKYGEALKADVLKVAHHGSNSSSSSDFLNSVSPKYAVISVGKNNTYSLPSVDVCERLEKISKVYMTKDNGNVCFKIGNTLKVEAYRQ
ncbi:MAG: MBL fold metallo-hydrolase, partial [Anaeroplasmataceae bacterium]|nr:MBL fold metallo-hydrolase [Anaeroplasmataceae bacterium]